MTPEDLLDALPEASDLRRLRYELCEAIRNYKPPRDGSIRHKDREAACRMASGSIREYLEVIKALESAVRVDRMKNRHM